MKNNNEPIPIPFGENEANYLLHVLDFNKESIQTFVGKVTPLDLLPITAFLVATLESQIQHATEAFTEMREFFRAIYPALLELDKEQNPDTPKDQLVVIVPRPSQNVPTHNPVSGEETKTIVTGNKLIN